ncbi:MAG TPA: hypothetical protein PK385_03525 [Spirochaetota bacterium]|jgi:hypothetical protein|nr:MAG: hypothetical protein BWX91_00826 [Spirochaetes bacterium ADurb.Bin133]HNZ26912.1 hypothetical protein [Spirochaetota bacterium]HOF00244.1 hypothetical protein [Spirochaetota bacterium]HOS32240.1 hypothetical protein [Spirochaetota bacterium]HOS55108.1 hypothetical protein [Spirochaetota bacterium]
MENDELDLIYKIKRKKEQSNLFRGNIRLSDIHNKVIDNLRSHSTIQSDNNKNSTDRYSSDNKGNLMEIKAQRVIAADKIFREALQELAVSLMDLGDKDIGVKLIGEHIMMLNDVFKEFE